MGHNCTARLAYFNVGVGCARGLRSQLRYYLQARTKVVTKVSSKLKIISNQLKMQKEQWTQMLQLLEQKEAVEVSMLVEFPICLLSF